MSMRRKGLLVGLLGALGGIGACSWWRPETPAPPGGTVKAIAVASPLAAVEPPPVTAADWLRSAEAAEKLGNLDVANACRGRAYSLEHDTGVLTTWIDGLIRDGEHGLARRVWQETSRLAEEKGGAELVGRIHAKLAALPKPVAPGPLAPTSIGEGMRAAYELWAGQRLDDAAAAFQKEMGSSPEPYHQAQAGSLSWRRDDPVRARREWSKARVALREAGASFLLVPVTTWHTTNAFWIGDQMALERSVLPIRYSALPAGQFQIWSLSPSPKPALTTYSASPPKVTVLSEDGRSLLRVEGGAVTVVDALSGVTVQRFETGEGAIGKLLAVGNGDDRWVVTAAGGSVKVWDAKGEALDAFALKGTTPTIMRVYRAGAGAVHDNVLGDAPTWVTSLALSKDRRFLAAGGSDSKVRLFDRTAQKTRELAIKWSYEERRHQGGNPDLNEPLDLRFSARGDRLAAIHRHGQLVTWSVPDGQKVREIAGDCSVEEATVVARRYGAPGDPARAPTAAEREGCGRAVVARFDAELRSVVTTGAAVRVRDVGSGAGTGLLTDQVLSDQSLAWSPGGPLSMVDLYGAVTLWRPGEKVSRAVVKGSPSGPIDPFVSANGRFLWFSGGERDVAWDLAGKRELPVSGPPRSLLALSGDGRFVARRATGGVEIVEAATGERVLLHPAPGAHEVSVDFSADGAKALLFVGQDPAYSIVLCDTAQAVCQPAPYGTTGGRVSLSWDGRRALAQRADGALVVWNTASGGPLLALGQGKAIRSAVVSRDGSAVAWLEQANREERRVAARWRRLDGAGAKVLEVDLDGWPSDIAVSEDGRLVWALVEGSLFRWKPESSEAPVEYKEARFVGARRVQVAEGGKTLILTGYDHVAIRATDAATRPVATLFPLLSGGFLVQSEAGAVDGSAEAPGSLITRVSRDKETMVLEGLFGWDAAHVEGLLSRALAGEDVAPVIPGASGGEVTSL